jgi:hypothetical protein
VDPWRGEGGLTGGKYPPPPPKTVIIYFFPILFGGRVYDDVQFLQLPLDPNIISGEICAFRF